MHALHAAVLLVALGVFDCEVFIMSGVLRFKSHEDGREWVRGADFDRVTAERDALQELLNQRDEANHNLEQRRHAEQQACQTAERRVEELETVRASLVGKVTRCKECGSDDLFWYSHIHNHSTVQHNRLNTNDVTCLLILGCNTCSETLMTVKADRLAERMTAALNPTAEAVSHDA